MPLVNLPNAYVATDCPDCGVLYYVPEHWLNEKRRAGGDGYCPNGHCWTFKETETDKLRRERDRLKQNLAYQEDRAASAERTAAAYRGQITKLKKRASAGVCPCCNRTFQNLHRHMTTQHPDYATLEVIEGGAA